MAQASAYFDCPPADFALEVVVGNRASATGAMALSAAGQILVWSTVRKMRLTDSGNHTQHIASRSIVLEQNICPRRVNLLENRVISKDFDASRYGLVGTTNSVFEYRRLAPRFLSSEEVQFEAVKLATHIISHWLDFPLDTLARYQGWFVHAIIQIWGERALLLEEVWQCHKNLRKSLLGNVTDKQGTLDILETLAGQLRDHPLAKHNSPEMETLCNIVGIIAQAKSGDLSYKPIISPGEEEERGEGAADVEMPEIPVLANVTSDGDGEEDGEDDGDDTLSDGSNPSAGPSVQGSKDYLDLAADHLLEEFCRFLEESTEIPDLAIELTTFQTELMKRMDYAYPYRELAPSRKHISGPDGPFTVQRARTNAGLLSAVIFRGITFGTEFMRSYPTFFTDIQDFHRVKDSATRKYVETHGKEPSTKYFCLKDAYGPCNHRRKVELADDYAAALENDSWAAKFEERDKVPFLECFEWLSGYLPTSSQRGRGKGPRKRRFPVLRPLASYLLAADLAYAEAVEPGLEFCS
ncbi:hypothetical protein B0H10DRAFT_2323557 [Mycena sp. CBHHK59/15]|nr:hypothetical protein B0H10DRAFT_2323557 [Mycena sp. CBHHK59/15]